MSKRPFQGICELALESDDPERLAAFYESLGLEELLRENGRIWFATGPRSRLGIWPPGEKEHADRGGSHVHFALSVDAETLDATERALRESDLGVEGPIEHEGGDRSIYFDDPEGNRVELWTFFQSGDGAEKGVAALKED